MLRYRCTGTDVMMELWTAYMPVNFIKPINILINKIMNICEILLFFIYIPTVYIYCSPGNPGKILLLWKLSKNEKVTENIFF